MSYSYRHTASKFTVSRSVPFLLTVHGVNDVSIDAIVVLTKQKQTKWCLVPKIFLVVVYWFIVLIKVALSRKRFRQLMNNHTASLEITVNVHESVLSRKLVFWTSKWKHVIKFNLYAKFSRIFAHNVLICATYCYKNFNEVCQVFWILHHYT